MQDNTCSGANRRGGATGLGHFAPSSQLAPSYRGLPSCKKAPKVENSASYVLQPIPKESSAHHEGEIDDTCNINRSLITCTQG